MSSDDNIIPPQENTICPECGVILTNNNIQPPTTNLSASSAASTDNSGGPDDQTIVSIESDRLTPLPSNDEMCDQLVKHMRDMGEKEIMNMVNTIVNLLLQMQDVHNNLWRLWTHEQKNNMSKENHVIPSAKTMLVQFLLNNASQPGPSPNPVDNSGPIDIHENPVNEPGPI